MIANEPTPVLREDEIYLGDNGRCFCEARRLGVKLACEGCRP